MSQLGSLPHAVLPSSSHSVTIIVQQTDQPESPSHHDSFPTVSSNHVSIDSARNTIFNRQPRSSISLSDMMGSQGDTASAGHKLCTKDGKSGLTSNGSSTAAVQRRGRKKEIIRELPNGGGFIMEDGEVYSSFEVGSNGSPIVCNGKGCRPLSQSEMRSLNCFMDNGSQGFGLCSDHTQMVSSRASLQSYYEKTLMENHCSCRNNPLFLKNFAHLLYEVGDDAERAEEYYERAILAAGSPFPSSWSEKEVGDGGHNAGEALSEYATLIWQRYGDKERAEGYFQRSIEAAPDDCHVLASHASFLWEAEEEES